MQHTTNSPPGNREPPRIRMWQLLVSFLPGIAAAIAYPLAKAAHSPALTRPEAGIKQALFPFEVALIVLAITAVIPAAIVASREGKWFTRLLLVLAWWFGFTAINCLFSMLGCAVIGGFDDR